ncbi:MAG: EthD family reductase [Pelagimonas sp.]|uniref:EthD family reductase n=1 Tax=Pelagimonas sp. TaxID=2073170 RepID=UPI003D6C0C3A
MSVSLQVLYPTSDGSSFDYEYYLSTHMALVAEHMGAHINETLVTKGLAGGPDLAPGYHAIATMTFADQAGMDAALSVSGPVLADIPNFTNAEPQMLIGQVCS